MVQYITYSAAKDGEEFSEKFKEISDKIFFRLHFSEKVLIQMLEILVGKDKAEKLIQVQTITKKSFYFFVESCEKRKKVE